MHDDYFIRLVATQVPITEIGETEVRLYEALGLEVYEAWALWVAIATIAKFDTDKLLLAQVTAEGLYRRLLKGEVNLPEHLEQPAANGWHCATVLAKALELHLAMLGRIALRETS